MGQLNLFEASEQTDNKWQQNTTYAVFLAVDPYAGCLCEQLEL